MEFGAGEGIEEEEIGRLVEEGEVAVGGAAVAAAPVGGGFREVEGVGFVGGEAEEGAACARDFLALTCHFFNRKKQFY